MTRLQQNLATAIAATPAPSAMSHATDPASARSSRAPISNTTTTGDNP
jgi:hypothetical protein